MVFVVYLFIRSSNDEEELEESPFFIRSSKLGVPPMLEHSDLGTSLPSFVHTSLNSPFAKEALQEHAEDELEEDEPSVFVDELEDPPPFFNRSSKDAPSIFVEELEESPFFIRSSKLGAPSMLGHSDLGTSLPSFLHTSLNSPFAKDVSQWHDPPKIEDFLLSSWILIFVEEPDDPPSTIVFASELEEPPPATEGFQPSRPQEATSLPSRVHFVFDTPFSVTVLQTQFVAEVVLAAAAAFFA